MEGIASMNLHTFLDTTKEIDFKFLEKRFRETASFDISEDKINRNFDHFLKILRKEGLVNEK